MISGGIHPASAGNVQIITLFPPLAAVIQHESTTINTLINGKITRAAV